MIIEIHYFCFGLYISNWKVFLLPTSHLWLLFFPTCNDLPSKVLTCLVTVYFSNVRLGTGGCAGPPTCCPTPWPSSAMPGQPTCSDLCFGRVLATGWGSKAEVRPWCRWQRGSGCIPRWDGPLGGRCKETMLMVTHVENWPSELPEKVEGRGEETS